MPTYEYKCVDCGHQFEIFQNITAAPLTDCPNCNKSTTLKRLIGKGGGIIFKGSGFYQTDYRSPSYQTAARSDTSSMSSSTSSSTGKSSEKSKAT